RALPDEGIESMLEPVDSHSPRSEQFELQRRIRPAGWPGVPLPGADALQGQSEDLGGDPQLDRRLERSGRTPVGEPAMGAGTVLDEQRTRQCLPTYIGHQWRLGEPGRVEPARRETATGEALVAQGSDKII